MMIASNFLVMASPSRGSAARTRAFIGRILGLDGPARYRAAQRAGKPAVAVGESGIEATQPGGQAMMHHYTVGMTLAGRPDHISVDAEDALIAALRVKHDFPQAMITYVRKRNARGDRRHPHHAMKEQAARR
jgi:hypothetical protein